MKETPEYNRASEIKKNKGDFKQSITLFDIDSAIISHLENTVLPNISTNGESKKIPVIYGNSERWVGARRQGVYRDSSGKIQLPLMMIRRTSISKDDTMPMISRTLSYQTVTKYSKDNRYDRFTAFGGNIKPKYELYNVMMPEYVDINYECMGWTDFTEQLNEVIESLNYASTYWGDKDRFKFRTAIADYNVINEVGEGTQRINRVEFTLNVKAYLLPEKYDGADTTKKSISLKRLVVSTEVDMTSGSNRLEGFLTTVSPYYDNKDLIDFLSLNNSKVENGAMTTIFSNIKLIKAPDQLSAVITAGLNVSGNSYDIKVYINGVRYYQGTHFSATVSSNSLSIVFSSVGLGFTVTSTDDVSITGKFINL